MNRSLTRTTAWMGLATPVLQFTGQGFIQAGGAEPPFSAPAADIAEFFARRDPNLFALGSYLSVLSVLTLLWFVGGLYAIFRDDGRAPIALACGIVYAAGLSPGWEIAAFRAPEGIDPEQARFAFDLGNLAFANSWVSLAGFCVAIGITLLASPSFPRWLGWWAIASGTILVAARAVWTTPFWFSGYALFWLWVLVLCVRLLRASDVRQTQPT